MGRQIQQKLSSPTPLLAIDAPSPTGSWTGRALIVNEATLTCSVASEIAATIGEKRFSSLDGPVRRLGSPFVPKPSTPGLEKLAYPSIEGIVRTAADMMPRRRSA